MARILVVDDDKVIRLFISEVLKRAGHSPFEAKNGTEALDLIKVENFDLVITDIFMPETSGLELIMGVRRANVNTRVIAISGDSISRKGGHVDCLKIAGKMGSSSILEKPFSAEQLIKAVSSALDPK